LRLDAQAFALLMGTEEISSSKYFPNEEKIKRKKEEEIACRAS